MTKTIANAGFSKVAATPLPLPLACLPEALDEVRMSVDRFCLLAGIETLHEMLAEDAEALCGPRHGRSPGRRGYRWGTVRSELAYHGGKVKIARPRVRELAGRELRLASWEALSDPDLLKAWALNLMVLTVSTGRGQGTGRQVRAGRKRAAGWRYCSHQYPAHRWRERRTYLGGAV